MKKQETDRYRARLLEMRDRLTNEADTAVGRVADALAPDDEISHVPTHPADQDREGLDRDIALESNRQQMLESIDAAIERIDGGSYGRCETCGGEISPARLDALPYAIRCLPCAEKAEQAETGP